MGALCAALFAWPASAAAPPIETYGRLPTLEQVLVSPDGTKLAYVRPAGESRKIMVQNLADGKMLAGVGVGDEKLRDIFWVGNGRIAFSTSTTGKPVELVTLDAEDHWLSRGATRTQMLQATVTFLQKANPPN